MTKKNKVTITVLILGAFLAVLNQTTMNPALPSVMKDLHVSASTAQWLSSGFTLVNAIIVALSAFLMDKYSTRKLFIGSFIIFFLGSLLGAWSPNFSILLTGRFLQAITSGLMLPMSMTILLLVFPKDKRGYAMGLHGLIIMFAPAIGPTISGFMTDGIGWRAMFLVMAALSAIIMLFAAFTLDNFGEIKDVKLDIPSVLLSSFGLFSLLYGFSEIGNTDVLVLAITLIVVGVVVLGVFSHRQLHMDKPFLEIGVLKDKQFATGTIISMLVQSSLAAAAIMIPLYLQNVRGMSATISGFTMMPGAILGAFACLCAGKLFDKFGARFISIIGLVFITFSTIGMAFYSLKTLVITVVALYSLRSVGLTLASTPINSWSISNLPNDKLNHGNALGNTLRQVASTMCVAILISVMTYVTKDSISHSVDPSNRVMQLNAALDGIHWTFYISIAIAVVALVMVVAKIKDVKSNKDANTIDEPTSKKIKLDVNIEINSNSSLLNQEI
ncbi:MAG: multidrug efflux MFS transporter [Clostridioides sp.]|jgi:EmrB/QacA subfamily drug resistance transporter|nr:multidrug efflux MFS transporter [Clostridioides sp.]